MGRIVAISGGDLVTTESLNMLALNMAGNGARNVLFVGTASNDAPEYITHFTDMFSRLDCVIKTLCLATKSYTDAEITALTDWADIIYVGGGDTVHMMNMWKERGFDLVLKDIYKSDAAVLMGISAGGICWFECGCTDSELVPHPEGASCGWCDGMLGILKNAFCPHYNERICDLDLILKDRSTSTYAMFNDTAIVVDGEKMRFVCSDPGEKAYLFKKGEAGYEKIELPLEIISVSSNN